MTYDKYYRTCTKIALIRSILDPNRTKPCLAARFLAVGEGEGENKGKEGKLGQKGENRGDKEMGGSEGEAAYPQMFQKLAPYVNR